MPVEYQKSKTVENIAEKLIDEYHTHLHGIHVEYLFRSEAAKSKGREVWGKARLITGLNAFLASKDIGGEPEPFFCIEIAKDIWDRLTPPQRIALVDHELSHCEMDADTGSPKIVGHDVEDFHAVVRRHGFWSDGLEQFVRLAAEGQGVFEFQPGEQAAELQTAAH